MSPDRHQPLVARPVHSYPSVPARPPDVNHPQPGFGLKSGREAVAPRRASTGGARSKSNSAAAVAADEAGFWPVTSGGSTTTCSRSEEHTSELQSRGHLVCRLLLAEKSMKQHT